MKTHKNISSRRARYDRKLKKHLTSRAALARAAARSASKARKADPEGGRQQ